MVAELRLFGLGGLPEIQPGDDLAALIWDAAQAQSTPIASGDVLVVTQKVVSKAEGRLVAPAAVEPSAFAEAIARQWQKDPRHVELILRESRRIVRMDRGVIVAETQHGFICASAGVDQSNVGADGLIALLPEDPDASARRIREGLRARGAEVAVIVSDTFGRPWREGLTDVAIGVAGLAPLIEYQGQYDPFGYELRVTITAVADELASAAELVGGKLARVPVAVIRGYTYRADEAASARQLVRAPERDLFR